MQFKKILLISPPSSSYLGASRPPQNLGYLAESLLHHNIDYQILDMRLGYIFKHLQKMIEHFNPDLIGITLVSLEYKKSYEIISRIKNLFPDKQIIVGGPHVTVLQEKVMEECQDIDFGVVYEGENTLVDLCMNKYPIDEIPGLIRRKKDHTTIYNGHREYKRNLDDIPFPTYQKFELNKYINEMPLNSSRGCPFKCIFCPNKMITKKYRWRSAEYVVDEIEYWYKKGIRVFNFDDDNFTFLYDRIFLICEEIERRGIKDAEFRCSNGLRADKIDRKMLERMKKVGFTYIAFGIDGGNEKMLRMNKKGETIDRIENAIRNACELGFDVKIFCIIGMPYETLGDIEDSYSLVQKYPVKRVILNNPIPYPGTELYEIVNKNNWFLKKPEQYLNYITENEDIPVFETPEISRETRIEILKKCRRIEKKMTRKAVQMMYSNYKFIGKIMGLIFASKWIQALFFKNRRFRQFIENIRHKRMLTNNN
jgi:radical SAM superfamily enzyme YgiQ (UPF0313 family)